jgi:hypothetical protein
MPAQTFLELGIWYYNIGRPEEAKKVLKLSPQNAEVNYWIAFLENSKPAMSNLDSLTAFPFVQRRLRYCSVSSLTMIIGY